MILKRILAIITLILIVGSLVLAKRKARHFENPVIDTTLIKDGDLIFQTSLSSQSKAIQLATKSSYSHCGIIYKSAQKFYVLEAVQPVKLTLLSDWIKQGKNQEFVVKRLKNAKYLLNPEVLTKMKEVGNSFMGKNYDSTFEWSDDQIYCSELLWKIYQRGTGIELGKLQHLKDFDLSNATVKAKLEQRYGHKIPMEMPIISPKAIFESDLLETITEH